MGSFCSSLFGSSASTSYQAPPEIKSAITDILGRAAKQSNAPYPQYTPATAAQYQNYNAGLLAPLSPDQAQAGQTISGLQGGTQPVFQQAEQMVNNAASPLQMQQYNQQNVNKYMNPYLNDVVNSAVANINQTNAQQQQQVLGNAIQKGAFGGDRAGIAQAELARQQNLSNNATISNLLNQGYTQAQGQFNNQQQTDLATQLQNRSLQSTNALNLANLGTQGQQAALQQAQAQYGYGSAEQQQRQAQLSTAYQQYMNQQAFPYQQLSYYAGLASGAAPAMGGTTTGYSPTTSTAGGLLGGLTVLGGLTNPGSINAQNPYSAASAGMNFFGNALPMVKTGGRINYNEGGVVGYATGGGPTSEGIVDAYTRYQKLVASHAPKPILDQAYQDYQKAFYGATAPYDDATVAAVKPIETTPAAATSPTATDTTRDGGGNARDNAGNGPVTAQNATYSPEFNSSNGPVGGGGYGPYNSGGGPGNTFNSGKNTTGGLIGGALGSLVGGPIGGLLGAALGSYNYNKDNVNTTPYDPTYKGVVSEAPVESSDAVAASNTAPSKATAGNYVNFSAEEQKAGLPAGYLEAVRNLESQNGALTSNNKSSALGDFQITKQTAEKLGIDPTNLNDAAAGTARLGKETLGVLGSYGVTNPTGGQVYGGHLLGAPDLSSLYSKPDALLSETLGQSKIANNPAIFGGLNLATATNKDALAAIESAYNKNAAVAKQNEQNYFNKPFEQQLTNEMDASTAADRARMDASKQGLGIVGNGIVPNTTAQENAPLGNGIVPNTTSQENASSGNGIVADPTTIGNGQGNISGVSPAASPDQSGLAGVGATTEGHGPGAGIGSSSDQNKAAESDKAIADQDAKEQAARDQATAEADTQVGDARTSDPDSAEKRGGRIHPHHYAAGGYAPISMMYGMPTESDISQIASDEAGSGGGVLSPQLAALAAKGVIPSANGGRIHKEVGGGAGTYGDAPTAALDMGHPENWNDDQIEKAAQQDYFNALHDYNSPKGSNAFMRGVNSFLTGTPDVNKIRQSYKGMREYNKPTNLPTAGGPENPNDTSRETAEVAAMRTNPAPSVLETLTPEQYDERQRAFETAKRYNMVRRPDEGGGLPSSNVVSGKTNPIIPKNVINDVYDSAESAMPSKIDLDQFGSTTPVVPKRVQVAQAAPQTMNDATKEVAPGIKQWYNAPPPIDMRQMAALNFGANLLAGGDFGSNLTRAGHDYANTMLAQQGEQRATMANEATSARERALTGQSEAETMMKGVTKLGPYPMQYVRNPDGSVSLKQISGSPLGDPNAPITGEGGVENFTASNYQPTQKDIAFGPVGGQGDAPEAVNKSFVFDKYKQSDMNRMMGDEEGAKAQFRDDAKRAQFGHEVATNTQPNLYQQIQAITRLDDHGALKAGSGAAWRRVAYDYFNTALPGILPKLGVSSPDALSDMQIVDKLSATAAQALGQDSAATWKSILRSAQPGADLQKGASNELLTAALIANRRDKANGEVMREYGNRSFGMGTSGAQVMADANPPALFNRDQQLLRDIFDNKTKIMPNPMLPNQGPKNENPATLLMSKAITPQEFDAWADKTYGPYVGVKHLHLSEYFK
jgi:hypothetical protein